MSKSTMGNYLKPYKAQYCRHWNSGTKSGQYIKTYIKSKSWREIQEEKDATTSGPQEKVLQHACGP
jgi:hypothetical protein